jgi:hypothetical protein
MHPIVLYKPTKEALVYHQHNFIDINISHINKATFCHGHFWTIQYHTKCKYYNCIKIWVTQTDISIVPFIQYMFIVILLLLTETVNKSSNRMTSNTCYISCMIEMCKEAHIL